LLARGIQPTRPAAVSGCRNETPRRAWLDFEVQPDGDGARLRQTAMFDPVGLLGAGLLVWRLAFAPSRVCGNAEGHC
jgi:hypothetical protein